MLIQVTTDNIEGGENFIRYIETEVGRILSRFSAQLTRIEIHLTDENGAKAGATDKRCVLEARPSGRQPVVVRQEADTVEAAWNGATKKLLHLLESEAGRAAAHKGGASVRTDDGVA
jgi:ribosome-associated translation inhibitor RaiA